MSYHRQETVDLGGHPSLALTLEIVGTAYLLVKNKYVVGIFYIYAFT